MAMGIVSDKDFFKEKSNVVREEPSPTTVPIPETILENPANGVIQDVNRGRGHNPEVPNSLRNLIGQTAIEGGRQEALELAASFGLSRSSVSAYTNGSTSTSSYDEKPNGGVITGTKLRIAKKARHKLIKALNHITDEKLASTNAKDLAGVAKDMSAVVKHMEEVENPYDKKKDGPTFIFYSPQTRKEEIFDVVQAKE